MIEGVKVKELKWVPDHRGRLAEILRSDDELFEGFGQTYMTTVFPGVVKAWHFHKLQNDHFCCVAGKIKVGLYDSRPDSATYKQVQEVILDFEKPKLVKIPALVYHGFKGITDRESVVLNIPTKLYNYKKPDEYRVDAFDNDIPFDWRK